jgi:hypothetical protein
MTQRARSNSVVQPIEAVQPIFTQLYATTKEELLQNLSSLAEGKEIETPLHIRPSRPRTQSVIEATEWWESFKNGMNNDLEKLSIQSLPSKKDTWRLKLEKMGKLPEEVEKDLEFLEKTFKEKIFTVQEQDIHCEEQEDQDNQSNLEIEEELDTSSNISTSPNTNLSIYDILDNSKIHEPNAKDDWWAQLKSDLEEKTS